MKNSARLFITILLVFAFASNALPCGPSYVTPVFEYSYAPENPYEDFAAGRLGIIKPGFHRSVLFAAYRYINGDTFTPDEQKALVDVWNADLNNKDYQKHDVTNAVNAWVEKRKTVVGKEEKTPDIYVERNYGGYDFFPNCTKNAFETATDTLADRISSYGAEDVNVKNWLSAQDKVFENCASGKQIPDDVPPGSPDWLQKDRAYQIAAASFYSLDYNDAKRRFAEIAQDFQSPWQETADYLVARTLIRQASLSKTEDAAKPYYAEAEERLQHFASRTGKFNDSAERLLGLVEFRLHPKERLRELAQKLQIYGGNDNFRQDLIDYTWLMDKFEKDMLEAEQKRKEYERVSIAVKGAITNSANSPIPAGYDGTATANALRAAQEAVNAAGNAVNAAVNATASYQSANKKDGDLEIYLYSSDYKQNWRIYVKPDATDDEAIAEAEKIVGMPLTDEMKKIVRESRRQAYANRFTNDRRSDYPGRYYGDEKTSLSLLPDFIRQDDLTDWMFTYQVEGAESYLHALQKFQSTSSDLWLMTAFAKADKNSTQLDRLFNAASRIGPSALAYPTIAYHAARILLEQGRNAEAKKLIDGVLSNSADLPVSTINAFMKQRLRLADTMDDFLRYSLMKPFAFDYDGTSGTIDQFIAEQKSYYDPENTEHQTREQYDSQVEEQFKYEKLWQDRLMFDPDTIEQLNRYLPLSVMVQMEQSPALPDYMREKFVMAIWTRAVLLGNITTADKFAPELVRYDPNFKVLIDKVIAAPTPAAKQNAILFFVLKNPILSPDIDDGMGKTDNEQGEFDSNDWWCAPYEPEEGESEYQPSQPSVPPRFLTPQQIAAARSERAKLKEIGDAPKFLAGKVLDWQKRAPADRRIPESLYIVYLANGWTKYGCGNNEELQTQIGDLLKRRYPQSEWTQKRIADESGQQ